MLHDLPNLIYITCVICELLHTSDTRPQVVNVSIHCYLEKQKTKQNKKAIKEETFFTI